jgi:hypothetical protein
LKLGIHFSAGCSNYQKAGTCRHKSGCCARPRLRTKETQALGVSQFNFPSAQRSYRPFRTFITTSENGFETDGVGIGSGAEDAKVDAPIGSGRYDLAGLQTFEIGKCDLISSIDRNDE